MKKAQNVEVETNTETVNPALGAAVEGLKSFSPGETYEFLQTKFPIYALKSKAHAKTASSLISNLENFLGANKLSKPEVGQIRLYIKTLEEFIETFEADQVEEIEPAPQAKPKKGFTQNLISSLKSVAESEKKKLFSGTSKNEKENQPIEASFRKVKKRK